ncbi:MAG: sulfotransferase [Saprospiraceae bacterium]
MKKGNTFFIVGMQRSGTTLLQKLLSQHSDIFMEPRSIAFRMISCMNNYYRLLPFNIQIEKNNFLQWLIKNDGKGRLAEILDVQNVDQFENVQELYEHSISQKLEKNSKKIWGDKSPNLQYYLSDLKLLLPSTKIIHIIRDGRSNAYSLSTRGYRNLKLSAQNWVDGNVRGIVNQNILGKNNYLIIKYEDLLNHPETQMRMICDFLNLPYFDSIIQLSGNGLAEEKNYVKSFFDTSKIDKWKTQLSPKEVKIIEKIQGPLLQKMGYELVNDFKKSDFKLLSSRWKIYYNQLDNFRSIFRKKKIGMRNQQVIELNMPLKNRLYDYIKSLIQDIFSKPIFYSLFKKSFYKKKYFEKE